MRLTLRTLLAYLDEILDGDDAQQLKSKIDESEVAKSLVHRIRGSVSRLRLDAPALDAQGIGGDLNSVAEYLDNTLSPDLVPGFEKVCLESDIHLSEVAACHQILTLVLGEPAAVTDGMRHRIYAVAGPEAPAAATAVAPQHIVAPPPRVSPSSTVDSTASGAIGGPHIIATEKTTKEQWRSQEPVRIDKPMPDYLRPRGNPWWRSVVIAAAVVFLMALAVFLTMGPLDKNHPFASWLPRGITPVASMPENPSPPVLRSSSLEEAADTSPAAEAAISARVDEPGVTAGAGADRQDASETSDSQAANPSADPAREQFVESQVVQEDVLPDDSGEELSFEELDLGTSGNQTEQRELATFEPEPAPRESEVTVPEEMSTDAEVDKASDVPVSDPRVGLVADEPSASELAGLEPVGAEPLGEEPWEPLDLAPIDDVVVRDVAPPLSPPDPAELTLNIPQPGAVDDASSERANVVRDGNIERSGEGDHEPSLDQNEDEPGHLVSDKQVLLRRDAADRWMRVDGRVPLKAGDQLLVLPAFRPQIVVSGVSCHLLGGTQLTLGADELFDLSFGKMRLSPGQHVGPLRMTAGSRSIEVEFSDASSVAALSVRLRHAPGENPEQTEAHRIVEVLAATGSIRVKESGQQHELHPGEKLLLFDQQTAQLVEGARLPTRKTGDDSNLDRDASLRLQPMLKPDRAISLALQERVEDRRYEVRALAVRCLGYLDQFDALVAALADPDQRSYWTYHVEVLREGLARGPLVAAQVRIALEKKHGLDARPLYEMLWGYSAEQLQAGGAEHLVNSLGHDSLDYRVLAFENLKEITGSTSSYRPWYPAARRRPGVYRWREQLENGQIKYKTKPEVLQLLETDLET